MLRVVPIVALTMALSGLWLVTASQAITVSTQMTAGQTVGTSFDLDRHSRDDLLELREQLKASVQASKATQTRLNEEINSVANEPVSSNQPDDDRFEQLMVALLRGHSVNVQDTAALEEVERRLAQLVPSTLEPARQDTLPTLEAAQQAPVVNAQYLSSQRAQLALSDAPQVLASRSFSGEAAPQVTSSPAKQARKKSSASSNRRRPRPIPKELTAVFKMEPAQSSAVPASRSTVLTKVLPRQPKPWAAFITKFNLQDEFIFSPTPSRSLRLAHQASTADVSPSGSGVAGSPVSPRVAPRPTSNPPVGGVSPSGSGIAGSPVTPRASTNEKPTQVSGHKRPAPTSTYPVQEIASHPRISPSQSAPAIFSPQRGFSPSGFVTPLELSVPTASAFVPAPSPAFSLPTAPFVPAPSPAFSLPTAPFVPAPPPALLETESLLETLAYSDPGLVDWLMGSQSMLVDSSLNNS